MALVPAMQRGGSIDHDQRIKFTFQARNNAKKRQKLDLFHLIALGPILELTHLHVQVFEQYVFSVY